MDPSDSCVHHIGCVVCDKKLESSVDRNWNIDVAMVSEYGRSMQPHFPVLEACNRILH